ncbi:MAG: hypothetical protein LBS20_17875 [Prevotella sp.]|nr:hypothetical protein [Prevotella sp.]
MGDSSYVIEGKNAFAILIQLLFKENIAEYDALFGEIIKAKGTMHDAQ